MSCAVYSKLSISNNEYLTRSSFKKLSINFCVNSIEKLFLFNANVNAEIDQTGFIEVVANAHRL